MGNIVDVLCPIGFGDCPDCNHYQENECQYPDVDDETIKVEEFEYLNSKEASIEVSFIDSETKKKITLKGLVTVKENGQ